MTYQTDAKPKPPPGQVYFVQATRSGLVKIGRSSRFATRLSAIRSQSPEPIRVLGVIEAGADAPAMERRLHQRFASCAVRGEWFRPSAEMLGFINAVGAIPREEWSPTFCQLLNNQRRFADLFAA